MAPDAILKVATERRGCCGGVCAFILAHWSKAALLAIVITVIVLFSIRVGALLLLSASDLYGIAICSIVGPRYDTHCARSSHSKWSCKARSMCRPSSLLNVKPIAAQTETVVMESVMPRFCMRRHNFARTTQNPPVQGPRIFGELLRFFERWNNWGGWGIFIGLYILNITLFLPGVALILGAGFVFGCTDFPAVCNTSAWPHQSC